MKREVQPNLYQCNCGKIIDRYSSHCIYCHDTGMWTDEFRGKHPCQPDCGRKARAMGTFGAEVKRPARVKVVPMA